MFRFGIANGHEAIEYNPASGTERALDTIPNDFRYWDGSLWGLRNTGNIAPNPDAAKVLLRYLASVEGKALFAANGIR